jgi:hypothetical protein
MQRAPFTYLCKSTVTPPRVGNFRQKNIPRKEDGKDGTKVYSDGIPAVLQNRKLSEFRSEPFRGRELNSEFRSVEQK